MSHLNLLTAPSPCKQHSKQLFSKSSCKIPMAAVAEQAHKSPADGKAGSSNANSGYSKAYALHPDFDKVQASRPDWHEDSQFHLTKTPNPTWKLGDGANDGGESLTKEHVEINPYAEGRPSVFNYKLLISGITPRPIAFLSTRSRDGGSNSRLPVVIRNDTHSSHAGSSTNLAPFSYTSVISHDPPLFTISISGSLEAAKDSLRNLADTRECTINIISEHFLEAANATAIDAPYGVSEWSLTGLTQAPCTSVSCPRVKEAVFSIEATLVETKQFESRVTPGKKTAVLSIVEGINFWVREDAINKERNLIDFKVLRPISRLGGISYGRTVEGYELPRLKFQDVVKSGEADGLF